MLLLTMAPSPSRCGLASTLFTTALGRCSAPATAVDMAAAGSFLRGTNKRELRWLTAAGEDLEECSIREALAAVIRARGDANSRIIMS